MAKAALTEAKQAISKIKRLVPKLSESERATLELLLDREAMSDLEKSLRDARAGRVVSLDKARKQLR